MGSTAPCLLPKLTALFCALNTAAVSEMGVTDTERSALKPEHPDKAGGGLVAVGCSRERSKGPISPVLGGWSRGHFTAGISEMQELPCLSLGSFVICSSPIFTLATSALQCSATEEKD